MFKPHGTLVLPSGVLFPDLTESRTFPHAMNQSGAHQTPALTPLSVTGQVPVCPLPGEAGAQPAEHTRRRQDGAASTSRKGEGSLSTDSTGHRQIHYSLLQATQISNQHVYFIAFYLPFHSQRLLPQSDGCWLSELNPEQTHRSHCPRSMAEQTHSVCSAPARPEGDWQSMERGTQISFCVSFSSP